MSTAKLIPIPNDGFNPFFFDEPQEDVKKPDSANQPYYKIYNDGGHYIGSRCYRSSVKPSRRKTTRSDIDILFDSLYATAKQNELTDEKATEYIKAEILLLFPDYPDLDAYVADKIERKQRNLRARRKRFRRKANLNRWNYFVTFTYDDSKQDEYTFRKKLRKCLSNLHTRRKWRYMGVFERAPETGRLHFHGVFYVPEGEMIGVIEEKSDYSTAQGKMQTRHENDFFEKAFGRNDFERLNEIELKRGNSISYILK